LPLQPDDWVDQEYIDDPASKKPEGYDSIPKEIPDPDAQKPADWDEEEEGEWSAPMIPNPDYRGPWKVKVSADNWIFMALMECHTLLPTIYVVCCF
jgi:hypothetical protein